MAGPQDSLAPQDIQAVYPPRAARGRYDSVFPHVIFRRSTLPWERSAAQNPDPNRPVPWLGLLLFTDQEIEDHGLLPQTSSRSESTGQDGDAATGPVAILDLPAEFARIMLPSGDDLPFLAHVRIPPDGGNRSAVVTGNRLPQPGARNRVYLVAWEGRYRYESGNRLAVSIEAGADSVRLVSLKYWDFFCSATAPGVHDTGGLDHLLRQLNCDPAVLQLPPTDNEEANARIRASYVPLKHRLRNGQQTVSWYHGPFVCGRNTAPDALPFPASTADALYYYQPGEGMFDVSYAAAWELGRLLALQSKDFAIALYMFRREAIQRRHQESERRTQRYPLELETSGDAEPSIPSKITTWLDDAGLLRNVPFAYLVADERMLPAESIRFFYIDSQWTAALQDGALSVGRVSRIDRDFDRDMYPADRPERVVSGVLLRSEAVAGWPHLQVDGFDSASNALHVLRREHLSDHVLLSLFEGDLARLEVYLKPEALHFSAPDSVPFRNTGEAAGVVDVHALALRMQDASGQAGFSAADFAAQLLTSGTKICFTRFGGQVDQ